MYYLIAYDISSARTRRIAVKCCKQAGLRRMQKSVFAGVGLPQKVRALKERLLPLLSPDDKLCVMPLDERAWKAMQSKGKGAEKEALAPQAGIKYL
jgi:CRISPR-associated endoribonuclease Cas2